MQSAPLKKDPKILFFLVPYVAVVGFLASTGNKEPIDFETQNQLKPFSQLAPFLEKVCKDN